MKRKTTIAASPTKVKPLNVTATPKHDYRDMYDGFTGSGKDYPTKVIHVTKTIAVQVPVPVPGGKMHDSDELHPTHETYRSVTPPVLPIKRTTKRPVTSSKIGSFEAHHMDNSIWQQNFPPYTSPPIKRKKYRAKKTTTEPPPTAGFINISQDPDTREVNINIPWNAAMKTTFMDDISRNPNPLLNSLNLLPARDMSSYGAPATGTFDIFSNHKELQDFSSFYNQPTMDDPLSDFHSSPSPSSFSSYTEHIQVHGGETSNVTSYYRYPTGHKRPKDADAESSSFRRPRKPGGKPHSADDSFFHSNSSPHFPGGFNPDDSTFATSDVQAKLREYEKRVEKEVIVDPQKLSGGGGGEGKESPRKPQPTRAPPPPPPSRSHTKKPKKFHITLIKKPVDDLL